VRVPEFTPSAEALAAARDTCARLDPLMTVAGFQAGQSGAKLDEVGVIYCTAHVDFRARFPRLAPDIDYADEGACTDLNIYIDVRASPRLAEVHLDGHGVDELLVDAGREDLVPDAQTLGQHALTEDLDRLHGLLLEIFGRAAGPAARKDWT